MPFYLIIIHVYPKNIGKIDKVLGIRIETIYNFETWDKLSITASPDFFVTLTLRSFNFYADAEQSALEIRTDFFSFFFFFFLHGSRKL